MDTLINMYIDSIKKDDPLYLLMSYSIVFLSFMIVLFLADSIDPDEMPQNMVFHLGIHCLP